jgi:undecaprenyl-phosphate 4-deoxy-4-formamido-L-arabinose transferase
MNISVVVPVYNAADTLHALVERLEGVLPNVADAYELILVNDGSPDDSWQVITALSKSCSWVRGVNLMRNYGQHNATLCGIRAASYEVTATMDDDLQNPPEELPKLLAKLEEGYDMVYGVSHKRQRDWWRSAFSALVKYVISLVMGLRGVRDISAYKVFRTHLRNASKTSAGPDVLVDVLLSWGTNRIASVEVEEAPRAAGESNYNFWKLIRVSLLVLTSYTTIPLRVASLIGFAFTILGMIGLAYVLYVYVVLGSVPGFSFLASAIIVFSGTQMFAIGIIGEYLARVFDRTGGRPAYVVLQTTDDRLKSNAL